MATPQISEQAKEFLQNYNSAEKDKVWQEQSVAFRTFWADRIMNVASAAPSDEDCDAVIRTLDRNGKGNTKKTEAVARAMIPQGAWRRMFAEFRSNTSLRGLMNGILEEKDLVKKATLIDQLYEINAGKKNNLTGESGNAVNAFLAGYNPVENLSVISLKDRRTLIEFLGLGVPFDWSSDSIGARMVMSNDVLYRGLKAAGIGGSARTVWSVLEAI